jgi:hypothetical protein
MQLSTSELGKVLTLVLYPVAVLGAQLQRVKFEGIINHDTARREGIDPAALHANVYSTLPPGTPNDYRKYFYGKFITENNQTVIIGLPYIASFTVHTESKMVLTINNIDPVTAPDIARAMCTANGFFDFEVDLV